ncbi:MAG: leucine-rich repeat domain-containing protein [Bacteroidaceae bacterium]|nr:leucine-rich repeat domain-containing protein [Bacteroidaceae bacterium]
MKAKLLLVFALLLTAVTGAWAQEEWDGDTHTATSNETIEGYIRVENDATLTISDGVTVTVTQGITISEGKTLTVVGPGTLIVNGSDGLGGFGGHAVDGNIIIQNANVTATGGIGGDGDTGNTGGDGGAAFSGSVTILSGSVTATGGQGGQGGTGADGVEEYDNGGDGGYGGYGGDAFAGTLTYYAGYVKATGGEGGDGGYGGEGGGGQGYPGGSGSEGFAFKNNVTFMTTDYSMTDENGNGIIYVSNNKIVEITSTATIIPNGNCGETGHETDVVWALTPDYTLVISGTGAMMYYGSELGSDSKFHSTAPWNTYEDKIKKVVVNGGVTYVGSYAFAYCPALTSVSLPASVTELGNYVCYSSNVARIDIPSTTAATIGTGGFDYTPAGLVIAVPAHLLKTYKETTNWSAYTAKLEGVLSETTGFATTFATGNYEYSRTFNCGVAATLCLPFELSSAQISPYGKVYTFDGVDKTTEPKWTVVMQETNPSNLVTGNLAANTPYLFVPYILEGKSKGDAMTITFNGGVTAAGNAGYALWDETSVGTWTFQGVYYNYAWNEGNENLGSVYGFAAERHYGAGYAVSPGDFVKAAAGASIAPFRAFLQFTPGSSAPNRRAATEEVLPSRLSVRLVNAEGIVTAIGTMDTKTGEVRFDSDAWYSIDGSRLNGKPAQKGVYINNGKKIIIK